METHTDIYDELLLEDKSAKKEMKDRQKAYEDRSEKFKKDLTKFNNQPYKENLIEFFRELCKNSYDYANNVVNWRIFAEGFVLDFYVSGSNTLFSFELRNTFGYDLSQNCSLEISLLGLKKNFLLCLNPATFWELWKIAGQYPSKKLQPPPEFESKPTPIV